MAPGRTDFQRHLFTEGSGSGDCRGWGEYRIRTRGRKNKEELKGTRGGERETGSARGPALAQEPLAEKGAFQRS